MAEPLRSYEVFCCSMPGRKIPGTTRRATSTTWVAVARGPLDPRVIPDGARSLHGPVLAASDFEAIALVKDRAHRKLIPWRIL